MKYLAVLAALAISPAAAPSGRATTTRYSLGQSMGACGCGTDGSYPFAWQSKIEDGVYTAAGSPALWRSAGSWCGEDCGSCYKLTSTGESPPGQGTGGLKGHSFIVMLTNLRPHQGNERWCPNTGQRNEYGNEYHFDIQTQSGQEVFGNNLIVDFESVPCPSKAISEFEQCQCKPHHSTSPSKPPSGGSGSSDSGQKQPRWAQCGGKNWHGPRECEAPYHCKEQNIRYSQCL